MKWIVLSLAMLFMCMNARGQATKPTPVEMNDDLWMRLINRAANAGPESHGYFSTKFAKMFELGDGTNTIRFHEGNFIYGNRRYKFDLVVEEDIDAIVLLLDVDGRGTFCLTDRSRKLRAVAVGDKDGIRPTTIDQSVKNTFKDILKVLAQVAVKLPPTDKQKTKPPPRVSVSKPMEG